MEEQLTLVDDFMTTVDKTPENIKFNGFLRDLFDCRIVLELGREKSNKINDLFVLSPDGNDMTVAWQFGFQTFGKPIKRIKSKAIYRWELNPSNFSLEDESFTDLYNFLINHKQLSVVVDKYGFPLALLTNDNNVELANKEILVPNRLQLKNFVVKRMYKGTWLVRKDLIE